MFIFFSSFRVEIEIESSNKTGKQVSRRFQVIRNPEQGGSVVTLKVNQEKYRFWMFTKSFRVHKTAICEKWKGVE